MNEFVYCILVFIHLSILSSQMEDWEEEEVVLKEVMVEVEEALGEEEEVVVVLVDTDGAGDNDPII